MQPYLTVVIPCFNEEQNIRLGALDKVASYLARQKYSWEVLIVDDGSRDQSVRLIKEFVAENHGFKLLPEKHQGKAGTVVLGMLAAKGEHILFTDLDQATPLDQIEKLWPWFEKDYKIVIGSRHNRRMGAPLMRRLMGPGFMILRNIILGLGIEDTQCGFKMFKREVTKPIFERSILFKQQPHISGARVTAGFDVELLFIARKLGYRIKEVAVEWHYVDTRRVSPFWDSLDALVGILKIRFNDLRGLYNFTAGA